MPVCVVSLTETILKGRCWYVVTKSCMIIGYVIRPPHGTFLPMIKRYCCHYQALGLYLSTHDRPCYSGRSWDTFKGRSSHPMSNILSFLTFLILLFFSAPPELAHKADACSPSPTTLRGRVEGTLCHTTSMTLGYHRTPPCPPKCSV